MPDQTIPPLPVGFTLDSPQNELPPLPAGFKLDQPAPSTDWQSRLKPTKTHNGKDSVQREDGGTWYGPEQGNTGKPGWFDDKGHRLGDAPGVAPKRSYMDQVGDTLGTDLRIVDDALRVGPGIKVEQGLNYLTDKFLGQEGSSAALNRSQDIMRRLQEVEARKNKVSGGHILAAAAPMAVPGLGATGTIGTRAAMLQGAKVGAGFALAQPVEEGKPFAPQVTQQAMLGAGFGAAVPFVVDEVAAPVVRWVGRKAANALAGTKLGKVLGIPAELNPKYKGAPELADDMNAKGIRTSAGDVTGDPILRAQEDQLARTNPKMVEFRLVQNQEASLYADRVVAELQSTLKQTGWKNLADVEAAAAAPGKRQGAAQTLMAAIKNSGDDWKEIAQQSGNLKLFVNKLKADALYDRAEAIARQYGNVKPTDLVGSLKANISALERNSAKDQSILPYLKGILSDVEQGRNLGFGGLRETRTALNGKINGLSSPGAAVADVNASRTALQDVTSALESDLDRFARNHSSGLRNAWEKATTHYRENVVPYKELAFGKALMDTDPMKAVNLFQGKNAYQQKRFFDLLDPKGQSAIRAGLIEDAVTAGEKTQRGVTGPTFSAAQVANKLEKLAQNGTLDVAFSGTPDRWAAQGLAKVLRTVDRADTIAFNPPTGRQLGMPTTATETNPLKIAGKVVDWLRRDSLMKLYTNPKGRVLLQRASSMKPGSKAMQLLIDEDIPKLLGTIEGKASPTNVLPLITNPPQAAQNTENE